MIKLIILKSYTEQTIYKQEGTVDELRSTNFYRCNANILSKLKKPIKPHNVFNRLFAFDGFTFLLYRFCEIIRIQ